MFIARELETPTQIAFSTLVIKWWYQPPFNLTIEHFIKHFAILTHGLIHIAIST